MLSPTEKTAIEESIFPEHEGDAVALVREWTLERLLEWDNDLRPVLVQALVTKVGQFGVKCPQVWYDILMRPAEYDAMHHDERETGTTDRVDELDPTWRPTEQAEREFLQG